MTAVNAAALTGLTVIALYAIFGGADFGGGVWDLLATGPRRNAQRAAITNAIGPVWEANHVWLIFAIVILFTCFPRAFADISVGLFAPLSFALIGIVLRGAAFIFRNHVDVAALRQTWTVVFGAASILAPFFLGDCAGAIATGRYDWTSPLALSIGLFAVVLVAQTAAVFLLLETTDLKLRGDFRRRAIGATFGVWVMGLVCALLAKALEPAFFASLLSTTSLIGIGIAVVLGLGVMAAVTFGADLLARGLVAAEAVAVLGGWFGAQAPSLVPGRFTYAEAASNDATLTAFLIAAAVGSVFLIPSLILLFIVFKTGTPTSHSEG